MKFFIILFFFINSNILAQYAKIDELQSNSVTKVYRLASDCGDCLKIPFGYNSAYHRLTPLLEPATALTTTKNQVSACLDALDCASKLEVLTCTDNEETAKHDLESLEVYCSKSYYEMIDKGRKHVVIDQDLKKIYDEEKDKKLASDQLIRNRHKDMSFGLNLYARIQILNDQKKLTKSERKTLRENLRDVADELLDGRICSAREDVANMDLELSFWQRITGDKMINENDRKLILEEIDAYKTCN